MRPGFTRSDYDGMYAAFLKAVQNCVGETQRSFRRDNSISEWVSIARYTWINRHGQLVRQKPCHVWRVPAVRFWPGSVLPRILKAYPSSAPLPPNDIDAPLRYIYEERVRFSATKVAAGKAAGLESKELVRLSTAAGCCADDLARLIADQAANVASTAKTGGRG
jgi:hypothetical protein